MYVSKKKKIKADSERMSSSNYKCNGLKVLQKDRVVADSRST
jgi:hypothetical protein